MRSSYQPPSTRSSAAARPAPAARRLPDDERYGHLRADLLARAEGKATGWHSAVGLMADRVQAWRDPPNVPRIA
ncbi:MAG: hypothetical protein WEE64_03010 [Dehalococcoidia bacterium]